MLTIRDETFEGLYPFTPHYYTHQGLDIHYIDEGSGEPVIMVHGDPTWGFLYRNFISPLSRHHRCIVPDQMGMGKSATPQDRSLYRLEQHCANLEALLLHLDLDDITLVLHDWGGPVGLGFATRHPDRIKRLVLMNTWAFAPWPGGPFPRLLEIIRSERGEAFVLRKNGYLEPALIGTTYHSEKLTHALLVTRHSSAGNRRVLRANETYRRWLATIQRNTRLASMGHARPCPPSLDPVPMAASIPTCNNA